jgi:hypothetical protein
VCVEATNELSDLANTAKCYIEGDVYDTDVLLVRGGGGSRHPGNQAFSHERDRLQPVYLKSTSREEKYAILCTGFVPEGGDSKRKTLISGMSWTARQSKGQSYKGYAKIEE